MELSKSEKIIVIGFTIFLGCAIIVIGLYTNCWFSQTLPPLPSLTIGAGRTADNVKSDIDNYKALVAIIKDNQSFLNDLLVVKFIKGLFDSMLVAIIAYLFGKPVVTAFATRIKGK